MRYWHAVELLQPQSAPKIQKRGNAYGAFYHDTPSTRPILPWVPDSIVSEQEIPRNRVWSHTLYAFLYDSQGVADALKELYKSSQGYREPQRRESALFAMKFTMSGHMVKDSFVLSSEAWFLGRALTGKDWSSGFDEDQRIASEQALTQLQGPVAAEALQNFIQWLLNFLGVENFFAAEISHPLRFRSQPVKSDKPASEEDPLNSFLLEDLSAVAESLRKGVSSEALDQYLSRHDQKNRLHIDREDASLPVMTRLMPQEYADGCWPSERHLGLVHSQQLAVNTILSTLTEGRGLLGVNGPPGTGKTTLLRDLIAAVITRRADTLATLKRASDGFLNAPRETANDGGKEQVIYKLNPALYGFEIVVASSNNGAVENVTLELPQRDKIDESWLSEAEHFQELGELIAGKPAWGLISGALGSKARRKAFVDGYFFGQGTAASSSMPISNEETIDDSDAENAVNSSHAVSNYSPHTERTSQKNAPQGLLAWLGVHSQRNKERTPEERQALWQRGVAEYEAAKAQVRALSSDASRIRTIIQTLESTRRSIAEETAKVKELVQRVNRTLEQLAALEAGDFQRTSAAFKKTLDAVSHHLTTKPGFLANLLSLWGASRTWKTALNHLNDLRDHAKSECDRIAQIANQLENSRQQLDRQIADVHQALQRMRADNEALTQQASDLANAYSAKHLLEWLHSGEIGRGDAIELAEPWHIDGWRKARALVFIQSLKLHRLFLELEAGRVRSNLFLINGILTGTPIQGLSRDAIRSAWASLFMVVPVLSSTFASFARSFRSLGAGEIGWLLVDESGQATPQAAVGALWRSRRALLVGDPLQLKPIVTVTDAVLEHVRSRYCVDEHWLPNRQSAQSLADLATTWGRMAGPSVSKTWVGLPLVVHRRCDRPMHSLANRIAYDGAMVYGTITPKPEKETPAKLPTGWLHVTGASDGNWVPAEGMLLQKLLLQLTEDGVKAEDISVITPFKAVLENIKHLVGNKIVAGTIHTMQGKEAAVVVMVLGGSTENPSARNWAVSEPNLLNVAATRAKRRFYVIGDHNDWKNRALFCEVMDLLPLQHLAEQQSTSTA